MKQEIIRMERLASFAEGSIGLPCPIERRAKHDIACEQWKEVLDRFNRAARRPDAESVLFGAEAGATLRALYEKTSSRMNDLWESLARAKP